MSVRIEVPVASCAATFQAAMCVSASMDLSSDTMECANQQVSNYCMYILAEYVIVCVCV